MEAGIKDIHENQVPRLSNATMASSPGTHIRGVVQDILLAFAIASIPMIALSALLLGLVFKYRVIPDGPSAKSFDASYEHDGSVIYIDLSATILTTVASWSSTMAPLVLPSIMTLISYPIAKVIIQASQESNNDRNPTPYQLVLILRIMCNASFGSLWYCITYVFTSRPKRALITRPLSIMTWILSMATVVR